jgi:hypothetical protein
LIEENEDEALAGLGALFGNSEQTREEPVSNQYTKTKNNHRCDICHSYVRAIEVDYDGFMCFSCLADKDKITEPIKQKFDIRRSFRTDSTETSYIFYDGFRDKEFRVESCGKILIIRRDVMHVTCLLHDSLKDKVFYQDSKWAINATSILYNMVADIIKEWDYQGEWVFKTYYFTDWRIAGGVV